MTLVLLQNKVNCFDTLFGREQNVPPQIVKLSSVRSSLVNVLNVSYFSGTVVEMDIVETNDISQLNLSITYESDRLRTSDS